MLRGKEVNCWDVFVGIIEVLDIEVITDIGEGLLMQNWLSIEGDGSLIWRLKASSCIWKMHSDPMARKLKTVPIALFF
jgi:hypothetical protein